MSEDRATHPLRLALAAVLLTATAASLLVIPPAHARANAVVWVSPTRADETHFDVAVGKKFTLRLTASTSVPQAFVLIQPAAGLPKGATLDNKTSGSGTVGLFTPVSLRSLTRRNHELAALC